jgi:serine protease inhibitor
MLRYSLFLVLLSTAFACKQEVVNDDFVPIPVSDVKQVADMNLAFGWEAFQKEAEAKPKENILISPLSIQTALEMAINGANGETRAQLLKALHCVACDVDDLNVQQAKLAKLLTAQSGHPRLTISNGFFYDQQRLTVHGPFKSGLETHYTAGFSAENFSDETAALGKINGWVNTATNGKIDKIIDQINQEDIAFLINALHFKADWSQAFPTDQVQQGKFKTASGADVDVDYVYNDANFTFAEDAQMRLLDLPFKDSTYSLSLIQPTTANASADWFTQINGAAYTALLAKAQVGRAEVSFPRFKLAYDNDLIPMLKSLGVQDAFSDAAADFSAMGTSSGRIIIGQVKHKAVLEVDEKGAEGAAVTSAGFSVTSVPPQFRFTKPFVLALRHIETNTLIFTGYLADPKG